MKKQLIFRGVQRVKPANSVCPDDRCVLHVMQFSTRKMNGEGYMGWNKAQTNTTQSASDWIVFGICVICLSRNIVLFFLLGPQTEEAGWNYLVHSHIISCSPLYFSWMVRSKIKPGNSLSCFSSGKMCVTKQFNLDRSEMSSEKRYLRMT